MECLLQYLITRIILIQDILQVTFHSHDIEAKVLGYFPFPWHIYDQRFKTGLFQHPPLRQESSPVVKWFVYWRVIFVCVEIFEENLMCVDTWAETMKIVVVTAISQRVFLLPLLHFKRTLGFCYFFGSNCVVSRWLSLPFNHIWIER